ncbi:alpha/beta fold hydrolase [Caldithrix abyssi]
MLKSKIILLFSFIFMVSGCDLIDPEEPGALVPPTVDQDAGLPQMKITVAHRTRLIHIETFGEPNNPVLLLLHGSASDYRPYLLLQILADKYHVVMWDQRGCGLSERVTEDEITWDAVVEEIDQIKKHFSPDNPVTLIGHSWGGVYAALYMSRRPENVRQAVLAEPGPALNGDIFQSVKNELFELNLAEKVYNDLAWNGEFLSAKDHEQMDYKYMMQLKSTMMNFFCDKDNLPPWPIWRVGAYVEYVRQNRLLQEKDFNFASGLDSFPHKVLILGSECSALGYDFQEKYHKNLFKQAEVVLIENSGHRLFTENLEAILQALYGYLDEYH